MRKIHPFPPPLQFSVIFLPAEPSRQAAPTNPTALPALALLLGWLQTQHSPKMFLLTHPIYPKYCLGRPRDSALVLFLHLIPHNHWWRSTRSINLLSLCYSGCLFIQPFFFTQIPAYCSYCHHLSHQNKAVKDLPIGFTMLLAPSTLLPFLKVFHLSSLKWESFRFLINSKNETKTMFAVPELGLRVSLIALQEPHE